MARKDTLYDFSGLKVHFLCVLQPSRILENVPCDPEKHVHSAVVGWCVLCMSVCDDWLVVMIGW